MKSYLNFLGRNKLYTAIEAVGLIISLAFVIIIGTYVWQQYNVAYENPDHNRIFVVSEETCFGTGFYDKESIDISIPEVDVSSRFSWNPEYYAKLNGKYKTVDITLLDKEFFELFPVEFIEGTPDVLDDLSNVLVSRRFANSIAGENDNVTGTVFTLTDYEDYTFRIAGIVEDFDRSVFPYTDIILNAEVDKKNYSEQYKFSSIGQFITFTKAAENTDINDFKIKLKDLFLENYDKSFNSSFKPVIRDLDQVYFCEDSYLTRHTSLPMLRMLAIIVLALLVSAVINYINLTFALSGKRAKEMATRRLVGANSADIFCKNILESICFTIVCFAMAILLAKAFVPAMNSLLIGEDPKTFIPIAIDLTPFYIIVCFVAAVVLGALSGFIPALNASLFQPLDVVTGSFRRKNKMIFSKVFITVQNIFSIVLISMAILMEVQLSYMMERPLNANIENLFHMRMHSVNRATELQPFIDRIKQLPEVKRVGIGSGIPGSMSIATGIKKANGEHIGSVKTNICDTAYFDILAPRILKDFKKQKTETAWLSESLAAALDLTDSTESDIAGRIKGMNGAKVSDIGGVFKDIPGESASNTKMSIYCMFLVQKPENVRYNMGLLIETTSQTKEIKDKIMAEYKAFEAERDEAEQAWMADYVSDIISDQLAPAVRTTRLVEIFMFLAVLLSLLGLIAMSTYFSEQKGKEIAIRKVYGGTIITETLNSVRSYMIMVLIACIIGVPIAVYTAGKYLEQFAYRVNEIWWIFIVAVFLSLTISFVSVLWQTLKAARTNPVNLLKKE